MITVVTTLKISPIVITVSANSPPTNHCQSNCPTACFLHLSCIVRHVDNSRFFFIARHSFRWFLLSLFFFFFYFYFFFSHSLLSLLGVSLLRVAFQPAPSLPSPPFSGFTFSSSRPPLSSLPSLSPLLTSFWLPLLDILSSLAAFSSRPFYPPGPTSFASATPRLSMLVILQSPFIFAVILPARPPSDQYFPFRHTNDCFL